MSFPPNEKDIERARKELEAAFKVTDSKPCMHIISMNPNMVLSLMRAADLLARFEFDGDHTIVTVPPNELVSMLSVVSERLGAAKHHIDRILERDQKPKPQVLVVGSEPGSGHHERIRARLHEAMIETATLGQPFSGKDIAFRPDIESAATREFIRRLQEPSETPVRLTESGARTYGPVVSNSSKAPKGPSRFHKSKSKRR